MLAPDELALPVRHDLHVVAFSKLYVLAPHAAVDGRERFTDVRVVSTTRARFQKKKTPMPY